MNAGMNAFFLVSSERSIANVPASFDGSSSSLGLCSFGIIAYAGLSW
jgi:hypothetical protein